MCECVGPSLFLVPTPPPHLHFTSSQVGPLALGTPAIAMGTPSPYGAAQ